MAAGGDGIGKCRSATNHGSGLSRLQGFGGSPDKVKIMDRRGVPGDGRTAVYRETSDMAYELTLSHENNIDVDQIRVELRDGVLRVELPRSEALKPREIAIAWIGILIPSHWPMVWAGGIFNVFPSRSSDEGIVT